MDQERITLIEEFSKHFENYYGFPPLTSKIFAYLITEISRDGTTFDELVEIFNASKSSVSNSLSFLSQLNYIESITKLDNRKRLYRISEQNIIIRLEKIHIILLEERKLSIKMKEYIGKKVNNINDIKAIKSKIYMEHLDTSIQHLEKTLEKLKQ